MRGFVVCDDCDKPYRGAFSKGRTKRYAYYVCQTKDCCSYGKSIARDKLEGQFEPILASLRPTKDLSKIAMSMFKLIWDKQVNAMEARQKAAGDAVRAIETKIDKLVQRTLEATQGALISVYEGQIATLERERILKTEEWGQIKVKTQERIPDFDIAARTALEFLLNPCIYWASGNINARRLVVRHAFSDKLRYSLTEGYRTDQVSQPFQLIQSLSDHGKENMMPVENMVPHTASI